MKVVEPAGRIWDDGGEGPEADVLFTVIILGAEPVNKKAFMFMCPYLHKCRYETVCWAPQDFTVKNYGSEECQDKN
jgi:hypothetical protein